MFGFILLKQMKRGSQFLPRGVAGQLCTWIIMTHSVEPVLMEEVAIFGSPDTVHQAPAPVASLS